MSIEFPETRDPHPTKEDLNISIELIPEDL